MNKQTKTWLLVGAGLAAVGLLMAFRKKTPTTPKKRTSVVADNPIKQTEQEFEEDYANYSYSNDPTDWMPEK